MYSIYTLTDPQTEEVRYIGLSKNVWKRYASHILRPRAENEKDIWVQGLLQANTAPILSVLETVETRKEAEARELYWIRYHLAQGIALLNVHKMHSHENVKKINHMMEEEKLRQFIESQGWNMFKRKRGRYEYIYAQKWRHQHTYIGPSRNLEKITEEYVLEKLANAL